MKFTKMHGLGNDFVILASPDLKGTTSPLPGSLPDFCRIYSDRRFGIGFDQALIVAPSDKADFSMAIYNADGSRVEMCGNGIRCVAKYLWDRGLAPKRELAIETPAGIIRPRREGDQVAVDMGVSVIGGGPEAGEVSGAEEGGALSLTVKDRQFDLTRVSMGNPHAVIFIPEVRAFPVKEYGPLLETHPAFPDRTNVEFVQVIGPQTLRVRVWERGAGETLACGTGACAAAVAAHLHGLTARTVVVHLAGGDLKVHLSENNHVIMTGPAVEVFEGEVEAS
ncbi:MAG: diaminopimelate epimerase [Nitrospirae bacterium]|nr:diaminopimelate epimerase [Nitrospirota bacterium]